VQVLPALGVCCFIRRPQSADRLRIQWARVSCSVDGPHGFTAPALAIYALAPLDAVLLSHMHYDDLDKPAV